MPRIQQRRNPVCVARIVLQDFTGALWWTRGDAQARGPVGRDAKMNRALVLWTSWWIIRCRLISTDHRLRKLTMGSSFKRNASGMSC